jgi:hypothetical protein
MRCSFLLRSGPRADAAVAAVEAYTGIVVHDDRLVIDIGHVGDVHVGDATVVEKCVPSPLPTEKADAGVAKAVVDATVKADVRTPVAAVPSVESIIPTPVARSPEHPNGGEYPGSGHPVIAIVVIPSPVPGRPEIAGAGAKGLRVNRQRWRADPNRNSHRNLRGRCWRKRQHQ